MTEAVSHERSFAGGEVAPEMYGRVDTVMNQTGLKTCRNAIVLPHGPVTRRPGFEYVLQTKGNGLVRLIPFSFNTEQTYIIEVGPTYMRFHTEGATVLSAAQALTSISSAYPVGVVAYTGADPVNGAWMYLAGVSGMTEVNGRFVVVANVDTVANTFEMKDLFGNNIDTSGYSAGTGGTMSPVYELATPYAEGDLFDLNFTQSADIMTIVHQSYAPRTLSRLTATSFSLATISFTPSITEPLTVAAVASAGTGYTYSYVVTAISDDNFEESIASSAGSCTGNLTTLGNYNTITWAAPATGSPVRYNVYKAHKPAAASTYNLYGYIGQTDGLSFIDDNIQADLTVTPPLVDSPFAGVGNYPAAVSYFEQRKVYGNTYEKPQNFWLTRTGTEDNLYRSLPIQDNDAIRGRIVAQQVNEIRHFVPLAELLVLTAGGEWVMSGTGGSGITPSTISVRPQAYEGAAKVIPQVTGSSVLYVQAAGRRVYEIQYSWESSAYRADDASIKARHLVDDYTLLQLGYANQPDQILWAVRSDGVLLGLTYVPKQEVRGWHQHTTAGSFKSVAVVQEDNRYVPYVVVSRTVNGKTRNYIERMHDRRFDALEDFFGVDSGLSYDGAATDTITGLWHLEGETLQVLGDGARLPDVTVTNGSVTLASEVSKAHLGLVYTPEITTLPMSSESMAAAGHGRAKSPTRAKLRVVESSGVKAGADVTTARLFPGRTTEAFGSPPALLSEEIDMTLDVGYSQDGSVTVTQDGPLPLTLSALVLEYDVGE